jgi:Mlc titration factor MtfA (ptsG expression regulator)
MPQDSVYLIQHSNDTSILPDTVKALLNALSDSVKVISIPASKNGAFNHNSKEGLSLATTVYLGAIVVVIVIPIFAKYIRSEVLRKRRERDYQSKEVVFDNILQQYNPYYKSLQAEDRKRFMNRAIHFMGAKDFRYIDLQPEEMMPLLISGAAVQLTFGLHNYLLDYFKTIYVLRDNYRYGFNIMPFEGHVNGEGIYLSWNNFIREYKDYSDGQNVGLHELAHALTYVNFTVHDGMDRNFHDKFKDFSQVARPVFERMQSGKASLFDTYAATNYQEFWACCIETFFERPEEFKKQIPDLYFALCRLLNQDPLTPEKIISLYETA